MGFDLVSTTVGTLWLRPSQLSALFRWKLIEFPDFSTARLIFSGLRQSKPVPDSALTPPGGIKHVLPKASESPRRCGVVFIFSSATGYFETLVISNGRGQHLALVALCKTSGWFAQRVEWQGQSRRADVWGREIDCICQLAAAQPASGLMTFADSLTHIPPGTRAACCAA